MPAPHQEPLEVPPLAKRIAFRPADRRSTNVQLTGYENVSQAFQQRRLPLATCKVTYSHFGELCRSHKNATEAWSNLEWPLAVRPAIADIRPRRSIRHFGRIAAIRARCTIWEVWALKEAVRCASAERLLTVPSDKSEIEGKRTN